jgi:hypothetical protein
VLGLPKDARERRLADLDRLPPQVRTIQLQQVEGVQEGLGARYGGGGANWKVVNPRSSQQTTSPSKRQDRTLR